MTKQIEVIYSSFIADAKKLASSSDDDDVVVVVVAVDKSRNSCPVFGLLSYLCVNFRTLLLRTDLDRGAK